LRGGNICRRKKRKVPYGRRSEYKARKGTDDVIRVTLLKQMAATDGGTTTTDSTLGIGGPAFVTKHRKEPFSGDDGRGQNAVTKN